MTIHYLQSFDTAEHVLRYDDADGSYGLATRAQAPHDLAQRPGYYTSSGSQPVGVFASPGGPVVFVGAERMRLEQGRVAAQLIEGEAGHVFVLSGRTRTLHIAYQPTPLDLWADDEGDFFRWLTQALEQPAFYKAYTTGQ